MVIVLSVSDQEFSWALCITLARSQINDQFLFQTCLILQRKKERKGEKKKSSAWIPAEIKNMLQKIEPMSQPLSIVFWMNFILKWTYEGGQDDSMLTFLSLRQQWLSNDSAFLRATDKFVADAMQRR